MFINLTMAAGGQRYDIRIDSQQRIGLGLEILRESVKCLSGTVPDYFRSQMNQKIVSAYKTFAQEQIYDGDMLTAIDNASLILSDDQVSGNAKESNTIQVVLKKIS